MLRITFRPPLSTLKSGMGQWQGDNSLEPATVVSVTAGNDGVGRLGSIVGEFTTDDEWDTGFLEGGCWM